jgi:hypothetical protein
MKTSEHINNAILNYLEYCLSILRAKSHFKVKHNGKTVFGQRITSAPMMTSGGS